MAEKTEKPRVRVTRSGPAHHRDDGHEITLSGLSEEQVNQVQGMLRGLCWMKQTDDGVTFVDATLPLPDPIEDPGMAPFWRTFDPATAKDYQLELFDPDATSGYFSPSIYISSLCGYHYTPENYHKEATKLERWGFSCMRSKRSLSGRYWEVWYLCGLHDAKEELKTVLECVERDPSSQLKAALIFLQRQSSFGSLSVSVQKLAMVLE